jgi:tetratricopeptide (TPR) repeat protein
MTVKVRTADDVPPTSDQFIAIVQNQGVARAKEVCDKFKLPTPDNPILADAAFTQMGYQFLQRGDIPNAVQVFAWGVAAWPNSANAWDSYGEACAANGDPVTALANYRKALEILPKDSQINPAMRTQLETSIPANILRLEQEVAARGNTSGGSR